MHNGLHHKNVKTDKNNKKNMPDVVDGVIQILLWFISLITKYIEIISSENSIIEIGISIGSQITSKNSLTI